MRRAGSALKQPWQLHYQVTSGRLEPQTVWLEVSRFIQLNNDRLDGELFKREAQLLPYHRQANRCKCARNWVVSNCQITWNPYSYLPLIAYLYVSEWPLVWDMMKVCKNLSFV